jgi:hypothetical protein
MKNIIALITFFICTSSLFAQQEYNNYESVDQFVIKKGPMDSLNIATIAETITIPFDTKEKKARAIYTWIATYLSLDPKATRSYDSKNTDPVSVIQFRKTTPLGFANLFQEMCSMANIRCLVVDGFTKKIIDDINEPADEVNHSWNVIQLGTSPDAWYYIDVSKACGYLDSKQTSFTKLFSSGYFFANKRTFNLSNFPDNKAWMLGLGPGSKKEFYTFPLIGNGAFDFGVTEPLPVNGLIKTKTDATIKFSFKYKQSGTISDVSIVTGEGLKQSKPERVNFTDEGGMISFTYKFKKEDSYPVKITANGQDILIYSAEVEGE